MCEGIFPCIRVEPIGDSRSWLNFEYLDWFYLFRVSNQANAKSRSLWEKSNLVAAFLKYKLPLPVRTMYALFFKHSQAFMGILTDTTITQ